MASLSREESSKGDKRLRKSGIRTRRKSRSKRNGKKRHSNNPVLRRINRLGETKLHAACIAGNIEQVRELLESNHPTGVRDYCGWTPLHEAANSGHDEIAELLIQAGANVNDPGGERASPLHDAASCGHFSMMLLLINNGADVWAKTEDGETILDCLEAWKNSSGDWSPAEQRSYDHILSKLSKLLQQSPEKSSLSEQRKTRQDSSKGNEIRTADCGQTIKNSKSRLRPRRTRNFSMVTEKIQSLPVDNQEIIHDSVMGEENGLLDGRTSLSNHGKMSIDGGSKSCEIGKRPRINDIDLLSSTRGVFNSAPPNSLRSVEKQLEASEFNVEIIRIEESHELEHLIKVEETTESSEDESKCSTIILAEALETETDTEEKNVHPESEHFSHNNSERGTFAYGETELHVACRAGNVAGVTKLLESNYPRDVRDFCGWTPLHQAASHGHVQIAKLLIKFGANVNDPGGPMCAEVMPLHVAASCGHLSMVQLLIQNGADLRAKTRHADTILSCFETWKKRFERSSPEEQRVYDALLSNLSAVLEKSPGESPHDASSDARSPEIITIDKDQPTTSQNSENVKYRLRQNRRKISDENWKYHLKEKRTESSVKIDGMKKNLKGETKLHLACIAGNLERVTKLLESDHPTDVQDYYGWTPLQEAANRGHVEIVELLIEHGANVDDPGGPECGGLTPLHDAASLGHFSTMFLLIKKGANLQAKTRAGTTILDCLESWKKHSRHTSFRQRAEYDSVHSRLSAVLPPTSKNYRHPNEGDEAR